MNPENLYAAPVIYSAWFIVPVLRRDPLHTRDCQVDELRDGNAQLQANIDGALPTKVELAALTRRLSDTEKNNADLLAGASKVARDLKSGVGTAFIADTRSSSFLISGSYAASCDSRFCCAFHGT